MALRGSTFLTLGQIDLGTDEEAAKYASPGFDWNALVTAAGGVLQQAAPAAITAFAPQPVQQGLQRGAAALPEEYRSYFQQYLPAASQPRAVMMRPESTLTSALPWVIFVGLALFVGGKFLR